jgi:hypothetical protein
LPERERGESIKSHKFGIMQHDELNNEDLMLRAVQRKSLGFHEDFETPVGVSDTIFAVNSDFQFLYMIGKWCNESGHNLFQGLLALNDYYLFCWHYGQRSIERDAAKRQAALTTQLVRHTSGNRIQNCVKTLLLMAQICEKLY